MTTRRTIEVIFAGHHPTVHGRADTQFLVAEVTTDGISDPVATARDEMALDLGSERYEVTEERLVWNRDHEEPIRLAVPLPDDLTETTGELHWTGDTGAAAASWTIPEAVRERLANPPAFRVESFAVPETAPRQGDVSATLTVANTGSSDGAFRAELGSKRISDQSEIAIDVPAGETRTRTHPVSLYGTENDAETIVLDWGAEKLDRTVEIES